MEIDQNLVFTGLQQTADVPFVSNEHIIRAAQLPAVQVNIRQSVQAFEDKKSMFMA